MATREQFLRQLWTDVINGGMTGHWIHGAIADAKRDPDAPFADLGRALERLLASGAARRDLCLIAPPHRAFVGAFSLARSQLYQAARCDYRNDRRRRVREDPGRLG